MSHTTGVAQNSYQPVHFGQRSLAAVNFANFLPENPDDDRLFERLRNSTLTGDENAPIDPSREDFASWEERNDIKQLRQQYEDARRKCGSEHPQTKQIAAKIQSILDQLSALIVRRRREEYFQQADELRARGQSTNALQANSGSNPRKSYSAASSSAATFIGANMRVKSSGDCWEKHCALLVAYLQDKPDLVRHLGGDALPKPVQNGGDLLSTPLTGVATPVSEPHADLSGQPSSPKTQTTSSTCLFGCGVFSSRNNLTRHTVRTHASAFAHTFPCPACKRCGKSDAMIEGASAWSNHAERFHGKANAPHLPSSKDWATLLRKKPGTSRTRVKGTCFLCTGRYAVGSGFSRHFNQRHARAGQFDVSFQCPSCPQAVLITGLSDWMKHAADIHRQDGQTGRPESEAQRASPTPLKAPEMRSHTAYQLHVSCAGKLCIIPLGAACL